jgi:hypothetical protein
MPGAFDPQYVVARSVLLDALEALGEQRDAVVVVGAQAIYIHTGASEFAVAEFTTDADITIDPALLHPLPEIESAMRAARFERGNRVGAWVARRDVDGVPAKVEVDLMVPETVGGSGRRAARLAGHAKEVARKVRGLEAALVDKATLPIAALDPADSRTFAVAVAGPAALLIAKLHKIAERASEREHRRLDDKDALDVLRLLRAIHTSAFADTFVRLLHADVGERCHTRGDGPAPGSVCSPRGAGSQMAVRAVGVLMPPEQVAESCAVLAADLVRAVGSALRP